MIVWILFNHHTSCLNTKQTYVKCHLLLI